MICDVVSSEEMRFCGVLGDGFASLFQVYGLTTA